MPPWRVALSLGLFPSLSARVLSTVVLSCFDTTRLSLSVFPSPPFSFFLLPFCFYERFTSVHRCQLSRIIIHSERMWFPFQITKYGASAHCTPYISFGWSLFSFLPWLRAWFRSSLDPPKKNPLWSKTRDRVQVYSNYPNSFVFARFIIFLIFSL